MRTHIKQLSLAILGFIFLGLLLTKTTSFLSVTAKASESMQVTNADRNQHVFDEAGLLSTTQRDSLEAMCIKYGERENFEIIIVTHNNPNAKDGEVYLEDFYDQMVYGDSVLLLIDMHNRDVILEGYGIAQHKINSNRGDAILNDIIPYLSDGEYEIAFEKYIKKSADYMKYDSEFEQIFSNVFVQIIISLIIGGVVVGIMIYHSSGRMTTSGNTYLDQGHSGLIGRKDHYIRTRVTRVRKPTQNNSSGGLKGGVSRGGHSHSTSRGKF